MARKADHAPGSQEDQGAQPQRRGPRTGPEQAKRQAARRAPNESGRKPKRKPGASAGASAATPGRSAKESEAQQRTRMEAQVRNYIATRSVPERFELLEFFKKLLGKED